VQDILRYLAWYVDFCRIATKGAIVNRVNSEVSGPNVTKFAHDVEIFILCNILKSELRYCNVADFSILIGCHGNVPWDIEKKFRSIIYTQNAFIRCKNCKGHCVHCQKSIHRIKKFVADWTCETVKCLMNGTVLMGSPNEYHELNISRPTLIDDFYYFFPANLV